MAFANCCIPSIRLFPLQLFYSLFQSLAAREAKPYVTVELKNGVMISGKVQAVDQFLNFKLESVNVSAPLRSPHLIGMNDCFIRGNVIRYIHLNEVAIDSDELQDNCRRSYGTLEQ